MKELAGQPYPLDESLFDDSQLRIAEHLILPTEALACLAADERAAATATYQELLENVDAHIARLGTVTPFRYSEITQSAVEAQYASQLHGQAPSEDEQDICEALREWAMCDASLICRAMVVRAVSEASHLGGQQMRDEESRLLAHVADEYGESAVQRLAPLIEVLLSDTVDEPVQCRSPRQVTFLSHYACWRSDRFSAHV
jgi:hypothetical protein